VLFGKAFLSIAPFGGDAIESSARSPEIRKV